MVKLVDTPDSKSGSFTGVAVQVRPLVPLYRTRGAIELSRTEEPVDRHCTVTVVGLIKSWERRVGLLVSSQFLKTI